VGLKKHNEYREKHINTEQMELDVELCKEAEVAFIKYKINTKNNIYFVYIFYI